MAMPWRIVSTALSCFNMGGWAWRLASRPRTRTDRTRRRRHPEENGLSDNDD